MKLDVFHIYKRQRILCKVLWLPLHCSNKMCYFCYWRGVGGQLRYVALIYYISKKLCNFENFTLSKEGYVAFEMIFGTFYLQ